MYGKKMYIFRNANPTTPDTDLDFYLTLFMGRILFQGSNIYVTSITPLETTHKGGGKHKHKGRTYAVKTGARGGRFIMVNTKKVYLPPSSS